MWSWRRSELSIKIIYYRKVTSGLEENAHDAWLVCNQSTEGPNYPVSFKIWVKFRNFRIMHSILQPANQGKCIRIHLRVILLCQTFINPEKEGKSIDDLTRDDLTCKITYCSVVNPGGWIKPNLLRAVYKKEYPKFLKRFTGYVLEQSKIKPIKF